MSGCQSLSVFILAARLVLPQLFTRASQGRKIGACAAPILKKHCLARRQAHDVFHGIVHRLDETGGGLRILVLRRRSFGLSCITIEEVIPLSAPSPNPVFVVESHVEPDRTVECS